MLSQSKLIVGEDVTSSSHNSGSYLRNFTPSQTLYKGLTQEEIVEPQRSYVKETILPKLSSSKSYRVRDRIKRTLHKIQKQNKRNSDKESNRPSQVEKRFKDMNTKSERLEESQLYYDYFKTNQPSLLFELTMDKDKKNRYNYFKRKPFVNPSVNVVKNQNILSNYSPSENSYYKPSPPMSSSSMKVNARKEFTSNFKNKRLCLENDVDSTTRKSITIISSSSFRIIDQDDKPFNPMQVGLPRFSVGSDFSSSTGSSKQYSIPTFRGERRDLSVPKLLKSIKTGSLSFNSKGKLKLTYQNCSFFKNLASDEEDISSLNEPHSISSASLQNSDNSNFSILDESKIKFNNKSDLLLYGTSNRYPISNSKIAGTKSILKNKFNTKKDIELEKAKNCDIVGIDHFLLFLDKYENRSSAEIEKCEEIRKKQLLRYYKEETQNLIYEHCDVTGSFPPPLPPTAVCKTKKQTLRRLTGAGQRDGFTKRVTVQ